MVTFFAPIGMQSSNPLIISSGEASLSKKCLCAHRHAGRSVEKEAWCVCGLVRVCRTSAWLILTRERVTNGERDAGAGRRLCRSARKLWHVVAKGMYSTKGCRFCFTPAG